LLNLNAITIITFIIPLGAPFSPVLLGRGRKAYVDGPLFHFGYGLSYTTFEYDDLEIFVEGQSDAAKLSVSFIIADSYSEDDTRIYRLV
jgi:beta-glucosidase